MVSQDRENKHDFAKTVPDKCWNLFVFFFVRLPQSYYTGSILSIGTETRDLWILDFYEFNLTLMVKVNHLQLKHYGYKMLVHKPTQIKGGTALICKSNLNIIECEDHKPFPECNEMYVENVWLEINLGSEPSDKMIVGCIYKHPGGSINI